MLLHDWTQIHTNTHNNTYTQYLSRSKRDGCGFDYSDKIDTARELCVKTFRSLIFKILSDEWRNSMVRFVMLPERDHKKINQHHDRESNL